MASSNTGSSEIQERIFAFLTDPAAHPGVTRIDTHAASVFLDARRALKIKRAVSFPFLDYSTLEKRKAACEEEIRINRPLAPQIYHDVVAITEDRNGTLRIGGDGKAIEYAVEMSRFDENRTLDHLAKVGPFSTELSIGIADAIAASHAIAPRAETRWIDSVPALIDENIEGLRRGDVFAAAEIEALARASREALAQQLALLDHRARTGFVRRCHGDLHLGNIVLIGEQPVLFDAIEFNPDIASVDVLYDLAFTLMDLLRYRQQPAANIVFNRYLATTPAENLDALGVLPLYMSIRAAIRAQVLLAKLQRLHADRENIVADSRSYFAFAQGLINPAPCRFVAIGGLSGTGKSLLSRMLAPGLSPEPGAVLLRSDLVRKELFQARDTERLPPAAYQADVTQHVYDTLAQRARRVLAQGHSVIVDAVFAQASEREAMAALARRCNVPLTGLFLTADLETRQARIGGRRNDASDATPEVAALQEHYNIGDLDWAMVDASGTPEQTRDRCRAEIAKDR